MATDDDLYQAAAYTVRDRLLERWIRSSRLYKESNARTVCYLSAEFLLGPQLANNMINLGITEVAREVGEALGLDFERIIESEEEPGLGNGGLGRLAACYMDSLATTQIPAIGYGIRYEFGIFDQDRRRLAGREGRHLAAQRQPLGDHAPEAGFPVGFGGHTARHTHDEHGVVTHTALASRPGGQWCRL